MLPAIGKNLRWLSGASKSSIDALRPVLETGGLSPIYQVNSRAIYKFAHPNLGPVAIKELRFETHFAAARAALWRRHRILCEYRAAVCFHRNGGITAEPVAAAVEGSGTSMKRFFFVMRWLEQAETLSERLARADTDEHAAIVTALVAFSFDCARRGLAHGRHSSENLLITAPLKFHVIDFSHAQLFGEFKPDYFARDVARIGARLVIENAKLRSFVDDFFAALADHQHETGIDRDRLNKEFWHILNSSKRRLKFERNLHSAWRGWPSRLRG